MSENSRENLLAFMAGKSITLGWDAVVAYQRDAVNGILEQQFVHNLADGRFFSTAEEDIPENHSASDNDTFIHASNLTLGKPLLSFDTANLDDSRASLKMPFLSGYFFTLIESQTAPVSITEYNGIFPDSNFYLDMMLSLQTTSGGISGQGDIYLDLSACEPDSITANLVDDGQACQQIGQAFRDMFSQASDGEKRYVLGSLASGDDNNPLSPAAFEIRTQAAPDGTEDGGVLAFIRTRQGAGGTLPTSQSSFPYLIPDDKDPASNTPLYSCSLTLANLTLYRDIIQTAYSEQLVGNGLAFQLVQQESAPGIYSLEANAGIAPTDPVSIQFPAPFFMGETLLCTLPSLDLPYTATTAGPFTVENTTTMDGILQTWQSNVNRQLEVNYIDAESGGSSYRVNINLFSNEKKLARIADGNTVSFETAADPDASGGSVEIPDIDKLSSQWGWNEPQTEELAQKTTSEFSRLLDAVDNVALPDIQTFSLGSLLFPNCNVLQFTDIALPGDMTLFGRIVPSASSLLLQPAEATVAAGKSRTFTLATEGAGAVEWTIRSPSNLDVSGRIQPGDSGTAVYTAPARAQLSTVSTTEVVTARFTAADGSPASASAVVIVSGSSINLNPGFIYAVVGAGPVTFTASVVSDPDAGVDWQGATPTGSPAPGIYQATCTPALAGGQTFALQTIAASVGDAGATTASLLVVAASLRPKLIVGGGSWASGNPAEVATGGLTPLPPYGERQLTALASDLQSGGYRDVTASCAWQILGDFPQGTINEQGRYVAPATFSGTTVTVMAIHEGEDFGYTVIPLTPGN